MRTENNLITMHGSQRIKERIGTNEKRAIHLVQCAIDRGQNWYEMDDFLIRHFLKGETSSDSKALAYGGYCWIISKHTGKCITVFKLPTCMGDTAKPRPSYQNRIKKNKIGGSHYGTKK